MGGGGGLQPLSPIGSAAYGNDSSWPGRSPFPARFNEFCGIMDDLESTQLSTFFLKLVQPAVNVGQCPLADAPSAYHDCITPSFILQIIGSA